MDNRAMIQQGLDYIEENLRAEITAAELAQMAHVSLYHYLKPDHIYQPEVFLSLPQVSSFHQVEPLDKLAKYISCPAYQF